MRMNCNNCSWNFKRGMVLGALGGVVLGVVMCVAAGCAVRRPVQEVVTRIYCDQRRPDGSCAHWAKERYPCVSRPDGGCTSSTR